MYLAPLGSPACLLVLASILAETIFDTLVVVLSDVLKLTSATFEDTVNSNPLILIEFSAPWALDPYYEEAATALKEDSITLASVDCVDETDLCEAKEIQEYLSTLKIYKNGQASEYTGQHETDSIVSYMVKQSLPAMTDVTPANHEEFQKSDKLVIVAYIDITSILDEAIIKAAGVTPPALVVYRSYDEPRSEYPYPVASATTKDLEDWLAELAIPIIDEVNVDNYAIYTQSPKPLAYLFIDPIDEKREEQIAPIRSVAQKFKSRMNFVWIDAIKFRGQAKALNLLGAKWPAFVVQNIEKQLKYPFDQTKDATAEDAADWVEKYLSGRLEPSFKSEPIPEEQNEAVYNVVGKTFEDIVYDDAKDVFVHLYTTWCGRCKRLAPVWEGLAEKYVNINDRLIIAKMEAQDNNDLPASVLFRISGFPTLKFKPAGTHEFIHYEGDRSLESLVKLITKHAKNSLDSPIKDHAQAPLSEDKAQTF